MFRSYRSFSTSRISAEISNLNIGRGSELSVGIFDRNVKRIQRERSFLHPNSHLTNYLRQEMAERLADKLLDIKGTLPHVLELGNGSYPPFLAQALAHEDKIKRITMTDNSQFCLDASQTLFEKSKSSFNPILVERRQMDEERFCFDTNTFDAIVSNLSLHWINDLPLTFVQINGALKNDRPVLGCMFGNDTLFELRTSLQLAELERCGGISPHVSPFTDSRLIGSLLTETDFHLITVDVDEIIVQYPNLLALLDDLSLMGENQAISKSPQTMSRDVLYAASAIYEEMYGKKLDDGTRVIPATFRFINFIGWKYDKSQPKAKARGSANISFKDLAQPNPK